MDQESLKAYLNTPLSLQQLELIIVELPQKSVFKSAIGERRTRKALLIKWWDDDGITGYGECSCRPDPFYSHEFVDGAIAVVKDYIFPLISEVSRFGELLEQMNRLRGWNFTKAAVEFAANDLLRNKTGKGLLEATGLKPMNKVPVGISLGLFDDAVQLQDKLFQLAGTGYLRLKFKITQGYNNPDILAVLANLDFDNVAFDANGAFDHQGFDDLNRFARMDRIIEQPYPPSQLYLHQEFLKKYKDFRICLDEEIESFGDVVSHNLAMHQLNIKPGRVGGLWNTIKIIDYCNKLGIDAWIGGMFETSIGRALNLQVAALLPEARAHDLSPSSRYFERDLVTAPIEMSEGFIAKKAFTSISIDEAAIADFTTEKITLQT